MKTGIRLTLGGMLILALLAGAALWGITWRIQRTVRENCVLAQQAHPSPGDDVAALVAFMNSTNHSLRDRNHKAVWTLGRLGDPRALPALKAVYTGESCNHDQNLCQYELEKAITFCGGTPQPPRTKKH